jgi:glutamate-5-semialdehyde dehydrogenase
MNYAPYFENAKAASKKRIDPTLTNLVLQDLAAAILLETTDLLHENKKDLEKMERSDPKYDRLELTHERIKHIAREINSIEKLESPLGHVLYEKTMLNDLHISKIRVPLGVIGIIYEARPNVTVDVFSLCFKTGNVCILKGGSDAEFSNQAIIALIHQVLAKHNIDADFATLLPAERDATSAMLHATGYVDAIIPRGSRELIDYVRNNSKVPVIETGAGIVHTYFDEYGDLEKGTNIINNAKTRRVSVCNALDCLIIHDTRLRDLPKIVKPLAEKQVELYADEMAFLVLNGHYPEKLLNPAGPEHFGTEFLSLKLSIKTVDNLDEALEHIATYGTKHSEAIISENPENIEIFLNQVDAAVVYVNASTAFTDGGQFGLGAEIGISTQKLHARGPMGLDELCTYKWIVRGNGQIRD